MLARIVGGLLFRLALALLVTLLQRSGPSLIRAEPKAPHIIFGLVTASDTGNAVQANLPIEARIDNVHYGQLAPTTGVGTQDTFTHAVHSGGFNYGSDSDSPFQVCADDPSISATEGGALTGDEIFFFVDGVSGSSVTFVRGKVQQVNLVISSLSATKAAAATASNDACTTAAALPTATPSPTVTATPTATGTPTPTGTPSPTATTAPPPPAGAAPAATETKTPTPTPEVTVTPVPTATATPVVTATPEVTPTTVPTATPIIEIATPIPLSDIDDKSVEDVADIIANATIDQAVDLIEQLTVDFAADLIQELTTATAAAIMEQIDAATAADVIDQVDTTRAADILSEVDPEKAGAIMEELSTAKVTDIVQEMPEDKLIERLPELSPEKLYEIPAQVLFDRLPNVPVDQLVIEDLPDLDPNLPPPVAVQVTPTLVIYTSPLTGELTWGKVVGSPAPIETILAKFTRQIANVQFRIEDLADVTDLPAGQIVNSRFSIDVENAAPEDIAAVHVTLFVEQDWIEANQIHKWSIQLNRFDGELNAWVPFPSKRVRENEDQIFYTTVLPGFSVLAITGSVELPEQVFRVTDLSISPSSPTAGEDITISARVANTSSGSAVYAAKLWIDNSIEAIQSIEVDPNRTALFDFTISKPDSQYDVRIERLLGQFVIGAAVDETPTPVTLVVTPSATPPTVPAVVAPSPTPIAAAPVVTVTPVAPTPVPTVTLAPPVPEAPAPTPTATPTLEDGLGTGAIVGIVIAILAGVGAVGAGIFIYIRREPPPPPSVPPPGLPPEPGSPSGGAGSSAPPPAPGPGTPL